MSNCISEDIFLSMIDKTATLAETTDSIMHMEQCDACMARHDSLLQMEHRLRWEGAKVRLRVGDSKMDVLVQATLGKARVAAQNEVFAKLGKEHLLHVLAPVCGERLTRRSIHLAARGAFRAEEMEHVTEVEWNQFAYKLGDILSGVCGSSVRDAVHHLSSQVLAGAA